jgi:hypothetical protein
MDLTASLQLATNLIRAGEGVLLLASITLPDKEQSALAAAKAEAYHAAAGEIAAHLGTLTTATATTPAPLKPAEPEPKKPKTYDSYTLDYQSFHFEKEDGSAHATTYDANYYSAGPHDGKWLVIDRRTGTRISTPSAQCKLIGHKKDGTFWVHALGNPWSYQREEKKEAEKPLVTVWATEGCAQFKFVLDGYTRQSYDTNNYCARRDGSTWVVHTYPLRARVCSFGSEYHMECTHKSGEVVRHYSNGLFETITMPAAEKKDEPEKEGKRKVPEGWYLDGCVKFHFEHKSGKMCGTDVYQCAKYSVVRRSDEWAVVDNNALKTLEKFPDDHLLVCTTPTGAQRVYTFKSMTPTIRPPAEQKEKEKGKEKKPEEKPADASTPELGESFTLGCKSFHFTELNGRSLVSGPYAGDKYMATVHKGSWRVLRRSDGFITDEVKPDRVLVLGLDGGGEIRCDNQGRRLPDGADKKEWLPQLSVPREKKPEEKPAEKPADAPVGWTTVRATPGQTTTDDAAYFYFKWSDHGDHSSMLYRKFDYRAKLVPGSMFGTNDEWAVQIKNAAGSLDYHRGYSNRCTLVCVYDDRSVKEFVPPGAPLPEEKKPEEKPAEKQSGVLPFGADGEAVVTRARSGPCEPIDLPPNCMFYLQHRYQVGVRTVELDHRRYVVTGQHSAFIRITGFGDKMDNSVDYPKDQYELYYYAQ